MTDEEMLQGLMDLATRLGKEPTAKDVDADKTIPSRGTYDRRFGSFSKAKSLAGFSNITKQKYSDDELKALLVDFYIKNNKSPTQRDCRSSNGLPGPNTFKDRFGGWEEALEAAGVSKNILKSTQVCDKELIDSLKRFYLENGRAPRHEDCNNLKEYSYLKSHMVYTRRFGTFTEALNIAGVPVNITNVSVGEIEVLTYVSSIYNGKIIQSYKGLKSHELDIYLPEKNIAIEFNGIYWHSDKFKDSKYHLNKTLTAAKEGIRVIHIFETEWKYKKEIVKSRLKHILNLNKEKIFARKCTIGFIDRNTAKNFLENTHIQGWAGSSVNIGLFYRDNLVAVMTFCKSRFNKDYSWELLRYSSNNSIVGGASKLLKYFRKHYSGSIISYSDIRWNTGTLYKTLGFELLRTSSPNYWYFENKANAELHSRLKFQKHKLSSILKTFDASKTEADNMRDNGFRRIYDCGNYVFGLKDE